MPHFFGFRFSGFVQFAYLLLGAGSCSLAANAVAAQEPVPVQASDRLPTTVAEFRAATPIATVDALRLKSQQVAPAAITVEGATPTVPPVEQAAAPPQRGKVEIIPTVGTTGIGASVALPVADTLKARIGINGLSLSATVTADQTNYDAKLRLFNVTAGVDYYPFGSKSIVFLTGGLAYQNNRLDLTGKPTGTSSYTLNGTTYSLDSIRGEYKYPNAIAPYVGVGLGTPINARGDFGFFANLGVIFAGKPSATLTPSGSAALLNDPTFQRDLQRQQDELNSALNGFPGIWPILSLGLSFKF
jgi:hypothetical protein